MNHDTSQPSPRIRVHLRLAPQLAMAVAGAVALTCSLASVVVIHEAVTVLSRQLQERGESVAKQLAHSAELVLIDGDPPQLAEIVRAATAYPEVAYSAFLDETGEVLVGQLPPRRDLAPGTRPPVSFEGPTQVEPWTWEFRAPVFATRHGQQDDEPTIGDTAARGSRQLVGTLRVGVTGESVRELRERLLLAAAAMSILLAILAAIAATVLSQRLTGPLRLLTSVADAIAGGDLSATPEISSHTEVGALARSFATMTENLRRSRRQIEESSRALEQTVRNRTERLETANRDLEDANRVKAEFLATVSHELRTPLHVILGYTSMMREESAGPVTQQQRDLLDTIQRYSKQQLDLLTDVLDFARLQSGRASYNVERFEIGAMLREVASLFQGRLSGAGGTVGMTVQVAPDTPMLETDRIKLQEIIRNLVDNAVKFTPAGAITIEAHADHATGEISVSVADTGQGISPSDVAHIFEPFRQLGDSRTRPTGGVGLGLSIVRHLCEGLGGRCTVVSNVNQGSTFTVAIPRQLPGRALAPAGGPT